MIRDRCCPDCRRLTSGDCGRHGLTIHFASAYPPVAEMDWREIAIALAEAHKDLAWWDAFKARGQDLDVWPKHGCICPIPTERGLDGKYHWTILPECVYHATAAKYPNNHAIPWNCPTYHDGCNCREKLAKAQRERDEAKEGWARTEALYIERVGALMQERDALRARLARCVAARLRRNTRWAKDKDFEGEWIVVPLADFEKLDAALDAEGKLQ